MKQCLIQIVLVGILCLVGLGLCPHPAWANLNTISQAPSPQVTPSVQSPGGGDFSDAEFAQADQAELGTLAGGDGVGLVLFILLVVLLVLLILWFLNSGPVRHTRLEIRNGHQYHEGAVNRHDHIS